jgi:alpha-glucosidase (family GH31 glycosyl hydrolase)
VIHHEPFGVGHPYRCEPFQRYPINPISFEPWAINAVTDKTVNSMALHLSIPEGSTTYVMQNLGWAKAIDGSAYGKTAKETASNTHLADAAIRSGEYPDQLSWAIDLAPLTPDSDFTYYFESSNHEISEIFSGKSSSWGPSETFQIISAGSAANASRISAVEWLLATNGSATKARFNIALNPHEKVVGFGERFHSVVQNGDLIDAVVYEEYKGQGHRTYLPIPFGIVVGGNFGFHIATSAATRFDLTDPDGLEIRVEVDLIPGQTNLKINLFEGSPTAVLYEFLAISGKPTSPPDWTFELWLSSNEWNTQERVEREVREALASGIEAGVVVIEAWSDESTFIVFRDAQYKPTDGMNPLSAADISYPPTGAWPNPKAMITDLHAKGLKLILWQIPILKAEGNTGSQSSAFWNHAIDSDLVVKNADGSPYRVKGFWFQDGLLPDLSNPKVRAWWTNQRRYLVEDLGVDGFKTDGGEHAWGEDLKYANGHLGIEMNNLFPVHYAQAYQEMMQNLGRQPITFSRAGFTGSSAFPIFWAGDENSTWAAFKSSINAGISASASGIFFWGWDIGGFSGEIPTAELYLRGTAMATFCPIMQIHSEFNHHQLPSNDRTPWNLARRYEDPALLRTFKAFVHVRKKLIPYLVAESESAIATGRPLMAGLFFDFAYDPEIWKVPHQYMLGRDLLVAPVTEPGASSWQVYLPAGTWFEYWDGTPYEGGKWHQVAAPLDQIPVFRRESEKHTTG